ncbi:hypothetical protein MBAV_000040, partial [Candidatus Magnetobacterium bavaricum]
MKGHLDGGVTFTRKLKTGCLQSGRNQHNIQTVYADAVGIGTLKFRTIQVDDNRHCEVSVPCINPFPGTARMV